MSALTLAVAGLLVLVGLAGITFLVWAFFEGDAEPGQGYMDEPWGDL